MKNFLKPTKFKIAISFAGGILYPISMSVMLFVIPISTVGIINNLLIGIFGIIIAIVSFVPGLLVQIVQSILNPASPGVDTEAIDGFYWMIYSISTIIFDIIIFYLIASLIEWRKNNRKKANEKLSQPNRIQNIYFFVIWSVVSFFG